MTRARLLLAVCATLVGCAETETTRLTTQTADLAPMRVFAEHTAPAPQASNGEIARDFLDLVFELENGMAVPVFTRFQGPITVAVRGPSTDALERDLTQLLARLRAEAGLDISRVASGPATITVEPVTRARIQRVSPTAACIVRPNVSSWDEFRDRKSDPATHWEKLKTRQRMAVFLPTDVSPQETRNCLHEEIAQALGPVNDLHRLTNSVFNDDDFHVTLTGFDMTILRAMYDPALQDGMSRAEVARRLPAILHRINPAGRRPETSIAAADRPDWTEAIRMATDPTAPRGRRLAAADEAVKLARRMGPLDARRAYANYVLGRLSLPDDPDTALYALIEAGRIYEARPDTEVQAAHVSMQIAAYQLATDRPEIAISLVDQHFAVAERAEHAALMSLMLMVKSESLRVLGRDDQAQQVERDAIAWGRYGFGSNDEVKRRMDEIAAISPGPRAERAPS